MASSSGPGSNVPVRATFVTMNPSGTRNRIGSSSRSSAPRQVIRISEASPIQSHPDATDGHLVAEAQGDRTVDAMAVHVRAVRAALVLHEPAAAPEGQHGVGGADEVILDV